MGHIDFCMDWSQGPVLSSILHNLTLKALEKVRKTWKYLVKERVNSLSLPAMTD